MTDSVISIFKILIKVPILISISFLILNLFGFAVCYFKILGVTYSIQQVVMENNYLPDAEKDVITEYAVGVLEGIKKGKESEANKYRFMHNATIYVGSTDDLDSSNLKENSIIKNGYNIVGDNKRQQYGNPMTVAVAVDFHIMVPLDITEITGGVKGTGNATKNGDYVSERQKNYNLGKHATADELTLKMPIVVKSQVIGMQYYSDLAM